MRSIYSIIIKCLCVLLAMTLVCSNALATTMDSSLIRRKVKMLLTRFAAMSVTKKGTKMIRDRRKTSV